MPFLKFELSSNLAEQIEINALLHSAGQIVQEVFEQPDVPAKSAVSVIEHFLIGDGRECQAFAYLTVKCFSGRTLSMRAALSERLISLLEAQFCHVDQAVNIAVDLIEIEKESTQVRYLLSTAESSQTVSSSSHEGVSRSGIIIS